MKTKLLCILGSTLLLSSCTQKKSETTGYTINGTLSGLSGKVYLMVYEGKMPTAIDSTQAENGQFSFTGRCELPIYASIDTLEPPQSSLPTKSLVRFFLENSDITIGNNNNSTEITVTGSANNDQYLTYKTEMDSLSKGLYIDSLAKSQRAEDSMMRLVNARKIEYVKSHPESIPAAYVLYRELSYYLPFAQLREAVSNFDISIRGSVYLKLVNSMADALEKTDISQKFTDIAVPDRQGTPIALSSVIGSGKFVLVDFWASWCPPCRAEVPYLVAAYKEYGEKGFEIYAISLDRKKEEWTNFITVKQMDWIQLSNVRYWDCPAAEVYGVRSIPANILIGPNGTILARNLMGEKLAQKLAELIK